jgi:hypothetical protein
MWWVLKWARVLALTRMVGAGAGGGGGTNRMFAGDTVAESAAGVSVAFAIAKSNPKKMKEWRVLMIDSNLSPS